MTNSKKKRKVWVGYVDNYQQLDSIVFSDGEELLLQRSVYIKPYTEIKKKIRITVEEL